MKPADYLVSPARAPGRRRPAEAGPINQSAGAPWHGSAQIRIMKAENEIRGFGMPGTSSPPLAHGWTIETVQAAIQAAIDAANRAADDAALPGAP